MLFFHWVAHTAFSKWSKDRGWSEYPSNNLISSQAHIFLVEPIRLRRTRAKFILGAAIDVKSCKVDDDTDLLRGLPSSIVDLDPIEPKETSDDEGPYSEIIVPDYFPPGSVMLFETHLQGIEADLDTFCASGAEDAFKDLDFVDLNVVLHRAEGEELDATGGAIGVYDVPNTGRLTYCGLEGWMHALRHIMQYNDLGHPLCANLREGTWAFDYIYSRLMK